MRKYSKKYWVFRWLFLLGYLAAAGVLIFEATIPGPESAKQSEAVGSVVGGIVNDMHGDQAKEVLPTKAVIKNKKLDYKVGEEITLEVSTSPEDASYKSYSYSSSNEEVASVNEAGAVSFLSAGSATIRATNTKVPEVYGEITFNVSNVEVSKMTSSINASKEGGTYLLEIYKTYLITNTIEPKNATDKTVTYEYEPNDYIEINDDTIKVIGDSGDKIISINVKCGPITNVLKVATFAPTPVVEDYPIEGIKASNMTKFTDQAGSYTPSVSYIPTYTSAKYKGYTLASDNDEVATIVDNKVKFTGTVGTATITITSTYDETISSTFTVTTQARPGITSVKIGSYSSVMYVGATQTVSATANPSSVKVASKTYTSSNTEAITVTNAGKLTANALGTSTITVAIKDSYGTTKEASFSVEVTEKPLNAATAFVVNYKVSENPIFYAEQEINLDEYFGIKSFIGNSAPLDNNAYDFDFSGSSDAVDYSAHKITAHKVGEITGLMTFTNEDNSVITNEIKFTVLDDFNIYKGEELITNLSLDVYTTHILTINDHGISGQTYKVIRENNTVVTSLSNKTITLTTKESGTGSITIIPIIKQDGYEDKELTAYAKTVTFNVLDILTTKMDITITHKNGDVVPADEEIILLYMNDTLNVKYLLDEKTTKSRVTMSLSNTNATIRNGLITPKKLGNVTLTVRENETGLVKTFEIAVRHKVGLNDSGPFLLSGLASYDAESNTINITNGDTAKIAVNFKTDTSYKKVTYEVEDESIVQVGNDGTITPLKAGITKVKVSVKDSSYTYIEFEINIEVAKRPFITDMGDFFRRVRKAIGHFGAFAVFGFLGTMMWFLWFRRKLYPVGVVLNFGLGFGLAYLTEYIQKFIPHRTSTWSDIWLDFSGFAIVAGILTLLIVIGWIIKVIYKAAKKKNHPELYIENKEETGE